jgi:hypothetical protein
MAKTNPVSWIVAASIAIAGIASISVAAVATASSPSSPKVEFQLAAQQQRHAALAAPAAPKNGHYVPVATQKLTREAGIISARQGPVPATAFLVSNVWQGPTMGSGDRWFVVWAGISRTADGGFGSPGIIVHTQTLTADGYSIADQVLGTFNAPDGDGALEVTGQTGSLISLRTPSGRVIRFDLLHLGYLSG